MPLLFIFILVPMIELAVLIKVGSHIGVLWTLALIFLTAIVGVTLLRAQGLATLMRAGQRLQEGGLPAQELAEGFLLALAGALLITPGFITDAIGFTLLLPGVRGHFAGSVLNMLKPQVMGSMGAGRGPRDVYGETEQPGRIHPNQHRPTIIDGEYRRED